MELSLEIPGISGKRYYDEQVMDVLSRLYGREKSPETILDIIGKLTRQEEKARLALSFVYEGLGFAESLRRAEFISEDTYFFLLSAEKSKTLKEFTQEYRNIKKRMKEVRRKFLSAMYSPVMAFAVSLVVLYIFIYRVIPQMNLPEEKALKLLPFYFHLIFFMSHNPLLYFFLIAGILFAFLALYIARRKIGFVEKLYGLYERLKLYSYLYLSTAAGYRIEDALVKYRGELKDKVERIREMNMEGIPLKSAMPEGLSVKDPVERTLLQSSLLADRWEMAKSMKELYTEMLEIFILRLETASEAVRLVSLLVVGLVLVFAYGFIFMPLLSAMKSIMM